MSSLMLSELFENTRELFFPGYIDSHGPADYTERVNEFEWVKGACLQTVDPGPLKKDKVCGACLYGGFLVSFEKAGIIPSYEAFEDALRPVVWPTLKRLMEWYELRVPDMSEAVREVLESSSTSRGLLFAFNDHKQTELADIYYFFRFVVELVSVYDVELVSGPLEEWDVFDLIPF